MDASREAALAPRKKVNSIWSKYGSRRNGMKIVDHRWTKVRGKLRLVTENVSEEDFLIRAQWAPRWFVRGALCSSAGA